MNKRRIESNWKNRGKSGIFFFWKLYRFQRIEAILRLDMTFFEKRWSKCCQILLLLSKTKTEFHRVHSSKTRTYLHLVSSNHSFWKSVAYPLQIKNECAIRFDIFDIFLFFLLVGLCNLFSFIDFPFNYSKYYCCCCCCFGRGKSNLDLRLT